MISNLIGRLSHLLNCDHFIPLHKSGIVLVSLYYFRVILYSFTVLIHQFQNNRANPAKKGIFSLKQKEKILIWRQIKAIRKDRSEIITGWTNFLKSQPINNEWNPEKIRMLLTIRGSVCLNETQPWTQSTYCPIAIHSSSTIHNNHNDDRMQGLLYITYIVYKTLLNTSEIQTSTVFQCHSRTEWSRLILVLIYIINQAVNKSGCIIYWTTLTVALTTHAIYFIIAHFYDIIILTKYRKLTPQMAKGVMTDNHTIDLI